MIQLMVNSGHIYAFIKSVVLQGITKYKHMEYRASLPRHHQKFMPLHRAFDFRRRERTLIKYAEKTNWFKNEKLGDPYKNDWRKLIKCKWMKGPKMTKKIRFNKIKKENEYGTN